MTARSAAELIQARRVAFAYRDMAVSIDTETRERALRNMPLTVRVLREYARILRRAAMAELIDPPVVPA